MRRVIPLVLVWALPACAQELDSLGELDSAIDTDGADEGEPVVGLTTDAVAYTLGWTWDRAEPTDIGWTIATDHGWTVHLEDGWLVDYAISLVQCSEEQVVEPTAPRTATGHGGFVDPSAYSEPRLESLITLEGLRYDPLAVYAVPYCDAHWLAARADDSVSDPEAEGLSLFVAGTVVSPGGGEPQPFSLTSTWADGVALPLPALEHATGITVHVIRDLDTMFDGVDFDALLADPQDELAGQAILTNLTDHASVDVEVS